MEALPTSFCCSFFSLKNPLARILGEVDNCACPSIAPCFFGGVGGSSYPRSSSCPRSRSLDLGLAVSRPWLNDVLLGATQRLLSASRSRGSVALFRVLRPRNLSVAPARSAPSGRSARGGFLDLENGAIWPLNGLRAKNSTFSGSRG